MNKKSLIIGIIIVLVVVGAVLIQRGGGDQAAELSQQTSDENPPAGPNDPTIDPPIIDDAEDPVVITFTNNGFNPRSVTVEVGVPVVFKNESSDDFWPASAVHPTHSVYPGSDIEKCGGPEEDLIFDSCGGVAPGESWSFSFDTEGEWGYHDHLDSKNTGMIVAELPGE
jgi:plastocyanin